MRKRRLTLTLLALCTCATRKGGTVALCPTLEVAPGGAATLECDSPQADPRDPSGPKIMSCTLDFGSVPLGETATANLTIVNDCTEGYEITAVTAPTDPEFGEQELFLPVFVASSVDLAVTFTPDREAALSDSFTLATDSKVLSKLIIGLRGSGVTCGFQVDPTILDFGKVIAGTTETRMLRVTNSGSCPITLNPVVPMGPSAWLFSVVPTSFAYPIPPGGVVSFAVSFAAPQPSYADEIAYLVVGGADGYISVPLKGAGVTGGLCVTTAPASNPPSLSFGHLPPGNSATEFIYVGNCANEVLEVDAAYLAQSDGNAFTIGACPPMANCTQVKPGGPPYALDPGDRLTYPIIFTPSLGEGYTGQFAVGDDHGNSLTVPLTGGGGGPAITCVSTPPTSPLALDFGQVVVGNSAVLDLVCTNTGNDMVLKGKIVPASELQIIQSGLTIDQPGSSFSAELLVDGLATQFVSLRAGEQCVVQVTYDPTAVTPAGQTETATLHIANNAVPATAVSAALSGQGIVAH